MIIKFKPVFMDKIWGGDNLQKKYNFPVSNKCGECWGISTHKNGLSVVAKTKYEGRTLKDLFDNEKQLFGEYPGYEFPILVKVVDAGANLSIQVHPDNEYAKKENSLGKEECWYILDAKKGTEIIVGHKATSKQQLKDAIENATLEPLCNSFPIKKEDFFYIETGTIHAICEGTTLLEVQQSSDLTYRVYDYNRLENGIARDLHIKQALDVINIPDKPLKTNHINTFFDYKILDNSDTTKYTASKHGDFIFIIDGLGYFNDTEVQRGEFLMVPSGFEYKVSGTIKYQKTTF